MWPLQNLTFYLLAGQQSQGLKTRHPFTVQLLKYVTGGNLYKKGILFMSRLPYQMPRCAIPTLKLWSPHSCKTSQPVLRCKQQLNPSKQQPQPALCSNLSMRGPWKVPSFHAVQVYFQAYLNLLLSGAVHNRWARCWEQEPKGKTEGTDSKMTADIPGFKWKPAVSLSMLHETCIINLTPILCTTHPKQK